MPLNRWLHILLSGRTTMPGMPENYSEANAINLLFDLEHMAAILDFTHNAMSYSTFLPYQYVGRTGKPHGRH